MEDLDQLIRTNLESIIQQRFAEGVTELSTEKIKKYLTKKFGIDIDDNLISELLSNNPNVESVVDDKITLGTPEQKEEESLDDEIHDNAVDQAASDLKFESVADVIDNLKTGIVIDPNRIELTESDDCYHIHYGAKKAKVKYIVSNILPKTNLNESLVRCKIDKSSLYVELPIRCFIKKV